MSDILERIYNIYYLYNKKAGDSNHDRKWKKAVIPTITGNEKRKLESKL